jgi:hypothetical protein
MNDDALLRLQFRMRSLSDPDSQGWRNAFPFAIDPLFRGSVQPLDRR